MDLAVIVVSFNTRELLADCLESALAGLERDGLRGQIWVVDNASADGSAEMVRQRFSTVHLPQGSVRLLAHGENVGFAAGNNLALARLGVDGEPRPRHVLFLNPDTRVVGNALGEVVRFMDATPEAGAAGARLVHGDGGFQHSAFGFPGLRQILVDFFPVHHRLVESRFNGRYPRRLYDAGQPFVVDHPLGAALLVRGQTLVEVGGFDGRFFMYCEEIDLCRRIQEAGWRIYTVPRAEIVHLVGQSTGQFRERMFVALWRSRFLMFDKHESAVFGRAARRLVRLGLWAETRRARAARRRGEISAADLERRLAAYGEVAAL